MIVIPAIDLRQGRCVRLLQGRFDAETVFSDDPVEVARRWVAQGAMWLHVVNLDGALQEDTPNGPIIREIVAATPAQVQVGGGLRSLDDIEQALTLGVSRVILGTAAQKEPQIVRQAVEQFGAEHIVVGIDARDRQVAVEAWQEVTETSDLDFGRQMADLGAIRCIYTDIARDGMGTGPNLEATAEMARHSGMKVIASGGIAHLDHIRSLLSLEASGIEGMVVGKALYTGNLRLPEILALADSPSQAAQGGSQPC
jgi:phosphoribosylformimino-5-aminoimidazole carboxamide ribotide isomerase